MHIYYSGSSGGTHTRRQLYEQLMINARMVLVCDDCHEVAQHFKFIIGIETTEVHTHTQKFEIHEFFKLIK